MKQTHAKVTSKYQITIPGFIRDHFKLEQGDTVEFAIVNHQVVLQPSFPRDLDYLRSVEQTVDEWNSPHDEAYNDL